MPESLPAHRLSVVVPVYNEVDSIDSLGERMHEALADYPHPWELLIVDDGSADGTDVAARRVVEHYGEHVRLLQLQRNFGQTAAMQAGIDAARGDVICTLDGDLQNDPADIPTLVGKLLMEDRDLVAGWRSDRQDAALRTALSRIANRLIGWVTSVRLHDYGCSLKAFRTEVIRNVRLYGEMHRFIPVWVAAATAPSRIAEQEVTHHARTHGSSKYNLWRTYRVLLDLMVAFFFMRFRARPGHFFGAIGLIVGVIGGVGLAYLIVLKLITGVDIGDRPLLLLSILLLVIGIQLLTTGILAEMVTRTYYESAQVRPYVIRELGSRNISAAAAWKQVEDNGVQPSVEGSARPSTKSPSS